MRCNIIETYKSKKYTILCYIFDKFETKNNTTYNIRVQQKLQNDKNESKKTAANSKNLPNIKKIVLL